MARISRLVLPVAGAGKRLRPLTLKTPKNLIGVNGKPLIEYVLEEARASRIKEVVLIVSPRHRLNFERYVRKVQVQKFKNIRFRLYVQPVLGGDGHALLSAYEALKGEPFAVRFCDDIIVSDPPVLQTLVGAFSAVKASVALVMRVPPRLVSRFGVVRIGRNRKKRLGIYEITDIVEKPPMKEAPSNLTIVGGYVLTPRVLENLKRVAGTLPLVADDALRIATALEIEIISKGRVYGLEFPGTRLDCGTLDNLRKAEEFLKRRQS